MRTRTVVCAALVAVLSAGCSGSDYSADDDLFDSGTAPSTSPSTPTATASTSTPTDDDLDRAGAAEAARTVLETWARPTLDYDTWWAALEPLLTPDAQESYAYTDPRNVPALKITSKPLERPEPVDPFVTTFYFETDKGTFGVDVARPPDGSGGWRAFSIIFPGSESRRQ